VFFKIIQHTADLQLEVYGKNLSDLFSNAVIAMFQSIKPEVSGCVYDENGLLVCEKLPEQQHVNVQAATKEELLVNFLSQALYLSDVHNQAYMAVKINKITETEVDAILFGVQVNSFEEEIKAVTYHDLSVKQKKDKLVANIIFDV